MLQFYFSKVQSLDLLGIETEITQDSWPSSVKTEALTIILEQYYRLRVYSCIWSCILSSIHPEGITTRWQGRSKIVCNFFNMVCLNVSLNNYFLGHIQCTHILLFDLPNSSTRPTVIEINKLVSEHHTQANKKLS